MSRSEHERRAADLLGSAAAAARRGDMFDAVGFTLLGLEHLRLAPGGPEAERAARAAAASELARREG